MSMIVDNFVCVTSFNLGLNTHLIIVLVNLFKFFIFLDLCSIWYQIS